jgi:hypothetical protein
MKKLFSLVLVMGLWMLSYENSFGNSHLKIVQLINFPDTAGMDTACHNIRIVVTNTGPDPFTGDIHVYCKSQSIGITDTLRDDPFHTIILLDGNAVDTVSLAANPQFSFRPALYASGDNIVVVWPSAMSPGFSFETYHTPVFLISNVGIDAYDKTSLTAYPNPVSQTLTINYADKNTVEQVRIYDLFGREVFAIHEAIGSIDLSGYKEGIYILEMSEKNGNRIVKKILVANE